MKINDPRNNQARECDAVRDLLDEATGGPKSRRGNVGAAVVVDDGADDDIHDRHGALADVQRPRVFVRFAHFGDDVEEGRSAAVGKDDGGNGRDGVGESGIVEQFIVGLGNDSVLGGRVSLDADSDGDDKDCVLLE